MNSEPEPAALHRPRTQRVRSAPAADGLDRIERRARELATEQAALRKVATLVAQQSSPGQLFAIVAEQVARIVDVPHVRLVRFEADTSVVVGGFSDGDGEPFPIGSRWSLDSPGVTATVHETGRPARIEDYSQVTGEIAAVVRNAGIHSAVASPIVVESHLWGAMVVLSPRNEPLPEDTESRLTDFTELVATAVSNAESRETLARLAEEQAALRRVAELVAKESPLAEVLAGVGEEVGNVLGEVDWALARDDRDGMASVLAASDANPTPVASRVPIDAQTAFGRAMIKGRPARIDDYFAGAGTMSSIARGHGIHAAVSCPIVVRGRTWGALSVGWLNPEPFPPETETLMGRFGDLIATAIANSEARAEIERLAAEQAALRRVATLVAEGVASAELFSGVMTEVAHVFSGVDPALVASVIRFDPGPESVLVGVSRAYEHEPLGASWAPKDLYVSTRVRRTGGSARVDEADLVAIGGLDADVLRLRGFLYQVGSPVIVEGQLWGAMCLNSRQELPPDTDERLEGFTELIATAIANAESREGLARLADEQATLQRIATLIAKGAQPEEVFAAVAGEVAVTFGAIAAVTRFTHDPGGVVLVGASREIDTPIGTRWEVDDTLAAAEVNRTGRPARVNRADWSSVGGPIGETVRRLGIASTVGSPIIVEGTQWGVITVAGREELRPDTEERLEKFTELLMTAIANAESSAELAASRRRIVAASDDARRRIERDLHDGVQQQLVSLALKLGMMKADPPSGDALREQLVSMTELAGSVLDALVETARGIHPAILSQGGLAAALGALARRSAVPVKLDARIDRPLPDEVEVAAYYVAAEALTNAAKHARASVVQLDAATADGTLALTIRDDGVGGAVQGGGSGLVGLQDRVEALGGTIMIDSSAGSGTCIVALPIATEPDQELETVLGLSQALGSPTSAA